MKWKYWASWIALLSFTTTSCTALHELPRKEYTAEPERKNVRVITQDGLTFDFDFVNVTQDSLIGYRERDIGGPVDEYASVQVSLEEISKLSVRGVSWKRTGLIGAGAIAAIVARGLATKDEPATPGDDGGGSPPGRNP